MIVTIDVELPEHIAAEWEVVAVRKPMVGECCLMSSGEITDVVRMAKDGSVPRVIVCRKDNPRDWWPKWITADRMTFFNDVILLTSNNAQSIRVQYDSSLIDVSRIPGHLRFSGRVIDNPWKEKVQ